MDNLARYEAQFHDLSKTCASISTSDEPRKLQEFQAGYKRVFRELRKYSQEATLFYDRNGAVENAKINDENRHVLNCEFMFNNRRINERLTALGCSPGSSISNLSRQSDANKDRGANWVNNSTAAATGNDDKELVLTNDEAADDVSIRTSLETQLSKDPSQAITSLPASEPQTTAHGVLETNLMDKLEGDRYRAGSELWPRVDTPQPRHELDEIGCENI